MLDIEVLEPAVDPNNRITFLLDWELTMKCNLDCSYCPVGVYGGHDNSTDHPTVDQCFKTIDFMFEYVDQYMALKPRGIRYVILNVYGGESLYHPNIVEILARVRECYQPYRDNWHLTVTTTTNAIIPPHRLEKILPYIDEFTASYHSESSDRQKQQFRDNLLSIAAAGNRLKCVVLMHQNPDLFEDAQQMVEWLHKNNIKSLPRQLDGSVGVDGQRIYNHAQVQWFDRLYKSKVFGTSYDLLKYGSDRDLDKTGRACCGGRQLCSNQNYKQRQFHIENRFPDWYCSVNHFFLFIKQVNGEIFVNKDCKMNFEGSVGPIGNLNDCEKLLDELKTQLGSNSPPIIQCKKKTCHCGLCAPKAKTLDTYKSIMTKYQKSVVK